MSCLEAGAEVPARTLVFLHGYGMEAEELLGVFQGLSAPGWRFVLPRAPGRNAEGRPAWFRYLFEEPSPDADYEVEGVEEMKEALLPLLRRERGLLGRAVHVGGLSQGGCAALALAAAAEPGLAAGAVTAVAQRLAGDAAARPWPAGLPWQALVATEDEVFPARWAAALRAGAQVTEARDNHYLEATDLGVFLQAALRALE